MTEIYDDDIELPDLFVDFQVDSSSDDSGWEVRCKECGEIMECQSDTINYCCGNCGYMEMIEVMGKIDETTKLRIVGMNGYKYQPDFFRSGGEITQEGQIHKIYLEYMGYATRYKNQGGNGIPLDICKNAAIRFNAIKQDRPVQRNSKRRANMATCFYIEAIKAGYSPKIHEIARMLNLKTKGIASGKNSLRDSPEYMESKPTEDELIRAEINTLFLTLEIDRPDLIEASVEVTSRLIKRNINVCTQIRTKCIGSIYEVLCRADIQLPIETVCCDRITKSTIQNFIGLFYRYHSQFKDIYKKYGLSEDKCFREGAR